MKKVYMKPVIEVEEMQLSNIICVSTIGPGQPNTPPGAREFNGCWDDEDDPNSNNWVAGN